MVPTWVAFSLEQSSNLEPLPIDGNGIDTTRLQHRFKPLFVDDNFNDRISLQQASNLGLSLFLPMAPTWVDLVYNKSQT